MRLCLQSFFFFNDTATTEIYTLSLHDALPIFLLAATAILSLIAFAPSVAASPRSGDLQISKECSAYTGQAGSFCTDRKSTRLNSSHTVISYAVFCLKKKKHNGYRHLGAQTQRH